MRLAGARGVLARWHQTSETDRSNTDHKALPTSGDSSRDNATTMLAHGKITSSPDGDHRTQPGLPPDTPITCERCMMGSGWRNQQWRQGQTCESCQRHGGRPCAALEGATATPTDLQHFGLVIAGLHAGD